MDVTEPAGGNRDRLHRRRRLRSHLSSLALLAVPGPGCHICCHAFPGETAGNQAASGPHAWVRHLVNGGEDLPPVAGGHRRPGSALRDITKEKDAGHPLRHDVEGGRAL